MPEITVQYSELQNTDLILQKMTEAGFDMDREYMQYHVEGSPDFRFVQVLAEAPKTEEEATPELTAEPIDETPAEAPADEAPAEEDTPAPEEAEQ